MNKLDSKSPSLTFSIASPSDPSTGSGQRPQPASRLIVLVPGPEVDLPALTRRVCELANATGAQIQFLGLYSDPLQEPGLRRELVIMSAMVKDGRVSAEADIIFGKDWLQAVRSRWQAGDVVVCFDEQRAGLSRRPLSQVLQSELDIPLYIVSGLYPQNDSRSTNWLARAAAWIGSIAIILGFLLLQVGIIRLASDWSMALQLLSIVLEAWLIWAWNNLFE